MDEDSTLFYYCWNSCTHPATSSTLQPQTSNQTLPDQSSQSKSGEEALRGSEGKDKEEICCERKEKEVTQISEDEEVMLSPHEIL